MKGTGIENQFHLFREPCRLSIVNSLFKKKIPFLIHSESQAAENFLLLMRRIQNKTVQPDLSFPEIKGTV